MKKVLTLFFLFIIFFVSILFFNKTFFKSTITIEGTNIKVPRYSYHISSDEGSAKLISLLPFKNISSYIAKYIEFLPSCYDESYFYDEDAGVTFIKYTVEKVNFYNEITIEYDKEDYCTNQYVLEENWDYDFIDNADIGESYITECLNGTCNKKTLSFEDLSKLINLIDEKDTIRIENKNNIPNNDQLFAEIYYNNNGKLYTLSIFEYNYYLAFKIIDANDHSKNAIYYIGQSDILNEIYEKSNNS